MNGAEIFVAKGEKEEKCAVFETKEGADWKKQVKKLQGGVRTIWLALCYISPNS